MCSRQLAAAGMMLLLLSGRSMAQRDDDVHGLPLVELRAEQGTATLAIVLSGDGGWADIDKEIGRTLAERGVDVIGFDTRKYLMTGHRNADATAVDVTHVANRFMREWHDTTFVLIGYSRGAAFAPAVTTRLPRELRDHLALLVMLGLPEHASFVYHFSDLWSTTTSAQDPAILPDLERLRGLNMMCVYGIKEAESLCRTADSSLVHPVPREGAHHFDGDYRAITDLILARLKHVPERVPREASPPHAR